MYVNIYSSSYFFLTKHIGCCWSKSAYYNRNYVVQGHCTLNYIRAYRTHSHEIEITSRLSHTQHALTYLGLGSCFRCEVCLLPRALVRRILSHSISFLSITWFVDTRTVEKGDDNINNNCNDDAVAAPGCNCWSWTKATTTTTTTMTTTLTIDSTSANIKNVKTTTHHWQS